MYIYVRYSEDCQTERQTGSINHFQLCQEVFKRTKEVTKLIKGKIYTGHYYLAKFVFFFPLSCWNASFMDGLSDVWFLPRTTEMPPNLRWGGRASLLLQDLNNNRFPPFPSPSGLSEWCYNTQITELRAYQILEPVALGNYESMLYS